MQQLISPRTYQVDLPQLSFGLVTPSYGQDFQRCQLLCKTRKKFWPESVKHYIIVDARDASLFRDLGDSSTEILIVEDILPWWIKRLPLSQQGWINFKGLPIRNWILQQLVKLSIATVIEEDIFGFVDSDVAFIRPFDPSGFVQEQRVRLYRNPASIPAEWKNFSRWYHSSARLLGIPPVIYPAPNFIGDLITWRRDLVLKLHDYLEMRFHCHWLETLANTLHWSEYILYGMFIEHVLKPEAGHYYDPVCPGLQYFSTQPMSDFELKAFIDKVEPEQIMIMISAKARIEPQRYEHLL
ncbi:MAG: hypothetical protein KGQ93_01280 [Cyanobacteria bacterium REEB459]|nr:hypothetical protein [Cyanobacteria bacterium REEB459]